VSIRSCNKNDYIYYKIF